MRNFSTYNKLFLLLLMMAAGAWGRLQAQDCNGMPAAGSVTASTTQTCSGNGNSVTLSLSGESSATGISLQWQSSPDNSTWTNIVGSTTDTYTYNVPDGFAGMYFRVAVKCNNSNQTAYTNGVQITLPLIAGYAQLPFTEGFEGDWIHICFDGQLPQPITGLNWNNLPASTNNSWRRDDNGSSANWSGPDYGAYTPPGSQGSNHSARFHSTYATASGMMDLYVNCATTLATKQLTFDYINPDGTDSLVVLLSTNGGTTFKRLSAFNTAAGWANKSILFSSSSATTIIRFMGVADNGNTDIGMDNINVQQVVACAGIPPTATAATNNSTICNGSPFILTASMPAYLLGYTYQWQSSSNGVAGWAVIPNSTDSTITITENTKTYYRAVVTCTISGDSSYSNTVAVNTPQPMAGTYTINSAVATGGSNFKSFTDAASALQCTGVSAPVVFNVKPGSGPYNEQMILDSIAGTSATNTVTFNGNNNTIHYTVHSDSQLAVIKLRGADYIAFNNLTIDARQGPSGVAYGYGVGVHLLNNADNNTFRNCNIIADTLQVSANCYGVMISGADNGVFSNVAALCDSNSFDNDTITGGYITIVMQSDAAGICNNNRFTNNLIQEYNFKGVEIYGAANTLIEHNTFSCPTRKRSTSFIGIDVIGGCSNTAISKNRFTNPYDGHPAGSFFFDFFGIIDDGNSDWPNTGSVVSNNLLYNIGMAEGIVGIMVGDNAVVYHNTIDIDFSGPANSIVSAIRLISGSENAVFRNNLVTINNTGGSPAYGLFSYVNTVNADYQDYYLTGTGTNNVGGLSSGDFKNLADWESATGSEAHSVTINPSYEDTAIGDLRPTAIGLDNLGTPVGITTDIVDAARSLTTPDIGAFEFKACVAMRGVYTIDAQALPGTAKTFTSFGDAYEALHCGIDSAVVFNVKPGGVAYNEQLNMEAIPGSSATNTVTFKGNGDTLRYNSANAAHKAVIEFNGTQHVIFDSLVIDATPPTGQAETYWGIGVQMLNNAGYNTIHACTILTDTTAAGYPRAEGNVFEYENTGVVMLANTMADSVFANHNMIDHNTIIGGFCGIGLDGYAVADSFINNNVRKFVHYGIQLLYTATDTVYNDSLLVLGNEVHSNRVSPLTSLGITAIEVMEANNVTIEKNIVHDLWWYGNSGIISDVLNNKPESRVYIVNNLIYNLGYDSTSTVNNRFSFGIINYSEGNVFIEHNTVAIHNTTQAGSGTIYGIMSFVFNRVNIGGYSTIKNNLINIDGDGQSKAACMFFVNQTPANQLYSFNYNNYYTGSNSNNAAGILNSAYISKLSDWTAQTGQDSNSVNMDAMFADTTTGNYKPTNYKFDNLGTPLGVLTDIVDTVRSTTHPDIGCYEFKACAPKFAGFSASTQLACTEVPVSFAANDTSFNYQTVDDWAWNFGNGTSSSLQNPVTTFNTAGTFNIQLTESTQDGCVDDTSKTITVVDCFKQLFIPNAFTPNGDGLNDQLRVYGNGIQQIKFMVFNQWGEKLFETSNQSTGWDGTQNGKMQPTGVYMYVCEVTMEDGRKTIKKGSVNLIR